MKNQLLLISTLSLFLFNSCTKDRVENPSSLNFTQETLYTENFDETTIVSPTLPDGWNAKPNSGWTNDSSASNISTGYAGASGMRNMVVNNDSLTSEYDTLISASYSTLYKKNITVTYGARYSKHFSDNGSSIISFSYSTDNGNSWIKIPYTENTNDSNWYIINAGLRMALPSDAGNVSSLKFRWIAHRVPTPSGSYRIDDFKVLGTTM